MNYYRKSRYGVIDDRPMLGPIEADLQEKNSDGNRDRDSDYDADEDEKFNRLLDEMNQELSPKHLKVSPEKDVLSNNNNHVDAPAPSWYKQKVQSKIKEAQSRLEEMSKRVFFMCPETYEYIKTTERDHGAVFCRMDYPKNPSLDKPWTNSWKFNCTIKCKDAGKPYHEHTADCENVVLEHVDTGVSSRSSNICHNEYPKFVMDAVELFQDFADKTIGTVPIFDVKGATDKQYDKSMWTGIKIVVRSNYEENLMLVVRGKGISSLIPKLRQYFDFGPGRHSNVISVFCLDQKWSRKGKVDAANVTGLYKLRDRIGSVAIEYKPKINPEFNSVETIELARIIHNYAGLTVETTLLDIGCGLGVLSLLMADKCETVIGVNTMHSLNWDMIQAEESKKLNGRENVIFVGCDPDDLLTKCSPFVKRSISVAVLNLSSAYGKNKKVMQALRDMPSIWRVIIYGSFTKEFHNNIMALISVDDTMGERFLPMQGCILDKSPSIDKAFDIVILFERKSLIEPKIELLAAGPTVNVKHDPFSWDAKSENHHLQMDRVEKTEGSREKCKRSPSPTADSFDIPVRRQEHSRAPRTQKEDRRERSSRSSPPTTNDDNFNIPIRRQEHFRAPRTQREDRRERTSRSSPSTTDDRRFDFSSSKHKSSQMPPARKEERIEKSKKSPPPKDRKIDFSILRQKSSQVPPLRIEKDSSACKSPRKDRKIDFSILRQKSSQVPPLRAEEDSSACKSPPKDRKIDFSILRQKSSQAPPPRMENDSSACKSSDLDLKVEEEKRSPAENHRLPSPPLEDQSHESSAPGEEQLPRESTQERPFPSRPLLSVRKEFQFSFLPRHPSPPPPVPAPSTGNGWLDTSHIKIEKDADRPSWTVVKSPTPPPIETDCPPPIRIKSEPVQLQENEDEPGLNLQNDGILTAPVKSETPTCSAQSSEVNCEDIPLPAIVKSEPVDSEDSSQRMSVKDEPTDMDISPSIENMQTPIHDAGAPNDIEHMKTPRASSEVSSPSPAACSTSFTTVAVDGFEFSVQANKSYLTMTSEPVISVKTEAVNPEPSVVNVKTEREDEIAIIGEKKPEKPKPRIRVKTVDEIVKVKTELKEKEEDELRELYERRQRLLQKLKEEKEPRSSKRHSSPSRSSRKHNRSPSPRRRNRSPSSKRRRRSSPSDRHRRRSPTRIKREPRSPDRVKREPLSPESRRRRDRRSPSFSRREARGRRRSSRSRSPAAKSSKR